ncbi:MAG: PH domain-containing protein [Nocardioides sp.]|nr:PH domain-containing protein [Nocardioides sp.]
MKAIEYTLLKEIPIPADITGLLVPGEEAVMAFKTLRDSATFTTKRLVVRDVQGVGKKVELYSLPYHSIEMWSSENLDIIDIDKRMRLWTPHAGEVTLKLGRGADIRRIDSLIAQAVLNR